MPSIITPPKRTCRGCGARILFVGGQWVAEGGGTDCPAPPGRHRPR